MHFWGWQFNFWYFFKTPTQRMLLQQSELQWKTSHSKKFQYYSHNRSLVAKVCVRTVNSTKEFRADQLILNDAYLSILKIRGCCVGHYTNLLCIKSAKPIWSCACKMQMSYFYELVVLQLKLDLLSSRAPIGVNWFSSSLSKLLTKQKTRKNESQQN